MRPWGNVPLYVDEKEGSYATKYGDNLFIGDKYCVNYSILNIEIFLLLVMSFFAYLVYSC